MGWSNQKIRDFSVTMSPPKSQKSTTVNLTSSTSFSLGILKTFISKRTEMSTVVLEAITFLNHLFAATPTQSLICVGRKFFTPYESDIHQLRGEVIEFRTGLFQAVHFGGTTSLTLNIDITTAVFWKSNLATVLHLAGELLRLDIATISPKTIQPSRFRDLARRLKGFKFTTNHLTTGRRLYTIHKVTQETARHYTFSKPDGTRTTVEKHYQNAHNTRLHYPLANLVATQSGAHFPMEMCFPVPVYPL
jgi:hypothetical protein